MKYSLISILFIIALANIFDTIREIFLKSSINSLTGHSPNSVKKVIRFIFTLLRIPKVWLSFLCSIASLFLYLFVLSEVDLNLAFSLDSMHYIFIAIAAKLFLKEKMRPSRWFGTVLVIAGIVLVTLS